MENFSDICTALNLSSWNIWPPEISPFHRMKFLHRKNSHHLRLFWQAFSMRHSKRETWPMIKYPNLAGTNIFFFLQKIMCSCLTLTILIPNFPSFQKTWWKKKYEYVVKLFAVKWSCGKTLAAMMLADFFFNCSENFMLNTDHTKIINLCLQPSSEILHHKFWLESTIRRSPLNDSWNESMGN